MSSQRAPDTSQQRDMIFISYSHRDRVWLEKLRISLKPYIQQDRLVTWDDTKIAPGVRWEEEIEQALASAMVAVLLVSKNFLASDYIAKEEFPYFLNAAKEKGLPILWIAVSHCGWKITPIAKYQATHDPEKPLNGLSLSQQDQVLDKICEKIVQAARTLQSKGTTLKDRDSWVVTDSGRKVITVVQQPLLLAGYLFVEKNGREVILARANVRLPIVKAFNPQESSIEQAINESVVEFFDNMGIATDKVLEAGFFKPFYCPLYRIIRRSQSQSLEERPCIFFKLGLNRTIEGTTLAWKAKGYRWVPKDKLAETWHALQSIYADEDEEESHLPFIDDPYQAICEDRVSLELGRKVLECVDMLIFQKNAEGEIRFLLIQRRENGVDLGWEYPKGGLFYHETLIEGALREIEEETGINANCLHYCGGLEAQTVNVQERRKFYDTLRVHGLTFYYTGDLEKIVPNWNHTAYAWRTFDEAKDSLWIPYGAEFFRRWEDKQHEILHKAGIVSKQS